MGNQTTLEEAVPTKPHFFFPPILPRTEALAILYIA